MTKPTAGKLLEALAAAQATMDTKNGEARKAKEEYEALRDQVIVFMDEQGTSLLSAAGLVSEIKETEVPTIKDWAELIPFLLRNKRLDLFQRRLSPAVWREMLEERAGRPVPGIEAYTNRTLSVRRAK